MKRLIFIIIIFLISGCSTIEKKTFSKIDGHEVSSSSSRETTYRPDGSVKSIKITKTDSENVIVQETISEQKEEPQQENIATKMFKNIIFLALIIIIIYVCINTGVHKLFFKIIKKAIDLIK